MSVLTSKLKPRSNKYYGWKKDLPDIRDLHYQIRKPEAKPNSVFLKDKYKIPSIVDQGNLGSCTGNGISRILNFALLNELVQKAMGYNEFSRLFIYYNERVIEGTVKQDSGAEIRDGIKSVAKVGCCFEKTWKYNISKFTNKPSVAAYKEALQFPALKYERVDNTNLSALVDALNHGLPIVFGFTVYDEFESDQVAKTGILPMPAKNSNVLGGHCVVIEGYDAVKNLFLIANSWGTDWGQKGYFWMPGEYLTNRNLASDAWVISQIQ